MLCRRQHHAYDANGQGDRLRERYETIGKSCRHGRWTLQPHQFVPWRQKRRVGVPTWAQAYEAASAMLTTQSESLTSDINDVIGADIAKLSTQLVQCQTLYSLALSMGSKIIPGTLADYL